ncbi:MAG TPA: hypothetical protein VHE36_08640 [Sphingomicrobium sp.]|jgi:hypothetical protein|nr:hypothetical protein [Sphingomicrobium sp.]
MNVKVRAEKTDGGIEWTIDGKNPKAAVHSFGRKSGPQQIHFGLDDATDLGLRFDEDPIWVHENDQEQCPPAGISTDQIEVISVNQKQLIVRNRNDGPARTLHYQLNLIDASGTTAQVDPVIKNGGSI